MSKKLEYHYYFIDEELSSLDSQDLSPGPRIFKVKTDFSFNKPINSDGPYFSVRKLKINSIKYKSYREKNNKRALKICNDKWIYTIENNGIITSNNVSYPKSFMDTIQHATKGSIINGKVSGVHFFDSNRVKLIEILNKNQKGVFEARFKLYDNKTNKWYEKESTSTFFPQEWSISRLFLECGYAFFDCQHVLISNKSVEKFKSFTKSGIEVIIIKRNKKVKTIFPVL